MHLPKRIVLPIAAALLSGAATAADDKPSQVPEILAAIDLVVAADGSVSGVVPDATLPEPLRKLLIARVSQWRYQVPTWQGKAAQVSTRLLLRLQAVPTTTGGFVMRVLGPSLERNEEPRYSLKAPDYPQTASRKRLGGTFIYVLRVEADGSFTSIQRKYPEDTSEKPMQALDESAQKAIMASKWRPFVVNGAPVSCEMLLPIVFLLPGVEPPAPVDSKPFQAALTDACPELTLETKIENTIL